MKILGLVTEYNPFHNGHLYHLVKSKEVTNSTHTIAVMSGNFLQRGEPSLLHKWARAEMAVKNGVDLIVELPTAYACSSAEFFARGAVSLLESLKVVDCISFGSEKGEISLLSTIADIINTAPPQYTYELKQSIKKGNSFPTARSHAIAKYIAANQDIYPRIRFDDVIDIIKSPNNILSIEYLKAIKSINSNITPYTIKRIASHYHSTSITSNIASATAIREHLKNEVDMNKIQNVIPDLSYQIFNSYLKDGLSPIFIENLQEMIFTIIRRSTPNELIDFFDVVEGLENKLYKCGITNNDINDFLECANSKRYTITRIKRILIHILLNFKKSDFIRYNNYAPPYARVLAFNNKGREILKLCKTTSNIPIINKLSKYKPETSIAQEVLNLDIRATNIYSLLLNCSNVSSKQLDYLVSSIFIK
ncbi:nucleotidyltransferase [Serpentinicella sp. ANB-PHB4]|uniref:nucleotidyltransferase n=1 Tax=Serpentinicella sp. ANB-PHB4 TaxID=3074076 RepID=UPI00285C5C8F|nr:nucleotidyltransferase [Serpentinicella sp. ANB-PHB4]MDR5658304.1 nucleotidyltransferase [Serpentinicella sp. ANB-PHB4]